MEASFLPELYITEDGSPTLYNAELGEHYHSRHGAVQESQHIFIEAGLKHRLALLPPVRPLRILEVGFGTGLNALMTLMLAQREGLEIHYTSLEAYPISMGLASELHFPLEGSGPLLAELHAQSSGQALPLVSYPPFVLEKIQTKLEDYPPEGSYDLIYFDAFSPEAQPELWQEEVFHTLCHAARPGAVLTTYCAKGEVRRRLQRSGWLVERLAGPPGKREMLRATKPSD